jgi:amino acid transporter
MAIWNRKQSAVARQDSYNEEEKVGSDGNTREHSVTDGEPVIDGRPTQTRLHRGLKARHITMIAIGGAIGTGLIIGTGKALAQSGPGSILISYTFVGMIVFLVMAALGEMAAWIPLGEGFSGYATRFCDPALGFALGYVSSYHCYALFD